MSDTETDQHDLKSVDCVYIAAFAGDARLTRICVASVRYFYPDVPIKVLAGSPLKRALVKELARYWNTSVAAWQEGDYGSGFVKLEPLFGPLGERFLMLDADTAIAGPVLDLWRQGDAPFVVDEEEQAEADAKRLYFDWDRLREIEPDTKRPAFVYNSGQWFGTAGVLTREDFTPWVKWTMPRNLRYPKYFMQGDQGVLNYVFNQKVANGALAVGRRKIMRWPVHSMEGVSAETIARRTAPPVVVHWAGIKKVRHRTMIGADVLAFFEKFYYDRLPFGGMRRQVASLHDFLSQWVHRIRIRARMEMRKIGLLPAANRGSTQT